MAIDTSDLIPTFVVLRTAPTTIDLATVREMVRRCVGDSATESSKLLDVHESGPCYITWHVGQVPYYLLIHNLPYDESWEAASRRVQPDRADGSTDRLEQYKRPWANHTAYVVVWCLAHLVQDDVGLVAEHVRRVMLFASEYACSDAALVWRYSHPDAFALPTPDVVAKMRAGKWVPA